MLWLVVLLAQTTPQDPISNLAGSSGWAGAGLLGLVLLWIFFWHLPAKDKQIKDLLDLFAKERESDRSARKEQSVDFKQNIATVIASHEKAILAVCTEFRLDMKAEREACEKLREQLINNKSK